MRDKRNDIDEKESLEGKDLKLLRVDSEEKYAFKRIDEHGKIHSDAVGSDDESTSRLENKERPKLTSTKEGTYTELRKEEIDQADEHNPFARPVKVDMDTPHIRPSQIDYIPDSPVYETEDVEDRELSASEDIYASQGGSSVLIEILDWIKYILLAVIIGLLLSYFVIQRSAVVGSSMAPTLLSQDQLLVEKVSMYFTSPEVGSIITLDSRYLENNYPSDDMLVKRVVAVAGDTVDFQDGKLYINGNLLEESYLPEDLVTEAPHGWTGALTIPEDHIYVLGDNRPFSADSRIFGPVPLDAVVGRVLVRVYPFARFGVPR